MQTISNHAVKVNRSLHQSDIGAHLAARSPWDAAGSRLREIAA